MKTVLLVGVAALMCATGCGEDGNPRTSSERTGGTSGGGTTSGGTTSGGTTSGGTTSGGTTSGGTTSGGTGGYAGFTCDARAPHQFCAEYPNYTEQEVHKICDGQGGTVITGHCPTTDAFGKCILLEGTHDETIAYYFPGWPQPEATASGCRNGGTWEDL